MAGPSGVDARGVLWGGNLALVCALLGTPYFPQVKGGILFVEDVNEHPYRIERMLWQLVHSGVLARLLGYSSPGQVNFRLNEARAEGLLPRSARAKYTVIGAGRAEYDLLVSATRDLAASLVLVHGLFARTPQVFSPDRGPRRPAARRSHSTDRPEDMLRFATSRWEVVQPPNRRFDVPARSGLAGRRTILP